jgi:hypothetical protein
METLLNDALLTLRDARDSGDDRVRLQAIRTASDINKTLLETLGEFPQSSMVTIVTNPQWIRIRTVVLKTLEEFPAARTKLITALQEIPQIEEGRHDAFAK